MLLGAALELVLGLATGLLEAIPVLVEALPAIVEAIIGFLTEAIPLIIDAGITLLTALVEALPQIITAVVAAIPKIVSSLISAIIGSIPLLIDAGIKLLIALIGALPQIIAAVVAAIPQIVGGLVAVVLGSIPQLVSAGVELLVSLIKNLPTIIIEIVGAAGQIITVLVTAFGNGYHWGHHGSTICSVGRSEGVPGSRVAGQPTSRGRVAGKPLEGQSLERWSLRESIGYVPETGSRDHNKSYRKGTPSPPRFAADNAGDGSGAKPGTPQANTRDTSGDATTNTKATKPAASHLASLRPKSKKHS
nr:hypothetical protein [Scrofimicrobium canadense]